jgi:hypothetical protein
VRCYFFLVVQNAIRVGYGQSTIYCTTRLTLTLTTRSTAPETVTSPTQQDIELDPTPDGAGEANVAPTAADDKMGADGALPLNQSILDVN